MAVTGLLFAAGVLSAWQQTACWTAIFFVASAAASAAYLTVGESFPLEMRALVSPCSTPSARRPVAWSARCCSVP